MIILEKLHMSFGILLKTLRQNKNIGIKTLAPDLDINYTYLSNIENNRSIQSKKLIKKIAKYFNYNIDELLLSANKIPEDISQILQNNPKEAVEFLRRKFGDSDGRSTS